MKIWPFVFAAALAVLLVRRRRSLEPPLIVGGVVVVAGLIVYGSGLVQLPNLEQLLTDLGDKLGRWTYLLVAAMAFLETGAFIGLLAPGETALIVGGVVAGQGRISLVTVIGIAWVCAVAGDCASYELGRRKGRPFLLRHGPRFGLNEPRIEQVEAFFDRHGGKAIFIGRFVGIVRAVAPFLAGSGRMPFRRFIPYDVLGAGLWCSTFLTLGYVFWHSLDKVLLVAKRGAFGLGLTISVVIAATIAVRWLKVPENRAKLSKRFDAALERPLLRPLRPFVRWLRGPVLFFWQRLTPGNLGLELTTLVAVSAATSYAFIGGWLTASRDRLAPGDRTVHNWAADRDPHGLLVDAARVLTHLGDPLVVRVVVVLVAAALLLRRLWVDAVVLGLGSLATLLLVQIAKADSVRGRPADSLVSTTGFSYPSGHTANAVTWVAIAIIATRVIPALRIRGVVLTSVAVIVVAVVGATRVVLRAHWLSDTIGGAGAGALAYAVVALIALIVTALRHTVPADE